MQTKCPQCTTTFNVSEQLLVVANGQVRCSQCKHVFDGRLHLLDHNKQKSVKSNVNDFSVADIKRRIKNHGTSVRSNYLWLLAACCVISILCMQLIWINKNSLAEHPRFGHIIIDTCNRIPQCGIEDKRDNSAFSLATRQIYSHPNEENALILSASFSNQADFAQPFPLLLVSMTDKQGEVIAERYFKPTEYRVELEQSEPEYSYNGIALMQANESININLALADPGKDALAFEIDFL